MSRTDAYFQFPIAIFKKFDNTHDVCAVITQYSLWHYGLSLYDGGDGTEVLEGIADEFLAGNDRPEGYQENNVSQNLVLAAAHRLDVPIRNVVRVMKNASALHLEYGEEGRQCRIRTDIVRSALKDNWPVLKLKVLCAIYAGIGSSHNRRMIRMTNRYLRALGAGHNSPEGLSESDLLAETTTRRHAEDLWCSNFFQRCSDGRAFWYSLTYANDRELAAAVTKRKRSLKGKKRVDINDV